MMQPANKVAIDTFDNQYRLAAKSKKQAAMAASTTMQKGASRYCSRWVGGTAKTCMT